jgi:hypothetical protein
MGKTTVAKHKVKWAATYKAKIRVISKKGLNGEGYTAGDWSKTVTLKVSKRALKNVISRSLPVTRTTC